MQLLKETFPKKTEEEILRALESASCKNEAAEKLLAEQGNSYELLTCDSIARYVHLMQKKRENYVNQF